jgi:hypothetical protein
MDAGTAACVAIKHELSQIGQLISEKNHNRIETA